RKSLAAAIVHLRLQLLILFAQMLHRLDQLLDEQGHPVHLGEHRRIISGVIVIQWVHASNSTIIPSWVIVSPAFID
ncbi:hypothetical protein LCGC14_3142630, partial [marine sediment metagenome]